MAGGNPGSTSLNRPGGNVTGVAFLVNQLTAKRLNGVQRPHVKQNCWIFIAQSSEK